MQPLHGVRVASLAPNLPGPLAAARLAQLGAEVTKVEAPSGDPLEQYAPGWYAELARGQQVLALDLKDQRDRAELSRLLATVDVLITAMRPSALARLGLDRDVDEHGLLHVEIVGHDGDRADEAGHDLTYQASAGTLQPPQLPPVLVADLLGGERAVSAALAGLRQRDLHGGPVRQRVVLEDVARSAADGVRYGLTAPGGPLGGALPSYAVYPTADGHVAVAALEPHFARRLAETVGASREELAERFATEPSEHWEALARREDLPIAAVRGRAARHTPARRSRSTAPEEGPA
ncbi:CoA transferase [Ornithinimicrobium sufpigmenti]|uniref:CoA transferase n=1 Tax=Ornithinimicrobium sufpigmenti TaxID=2508882 RepID=UPI001036BD6F|nr:MULTISPECIES: CoA transferase [unclassified Ornithinimicrobium]